jgi:hypothetical protein
VAACRKTLDLEDKRAFRIVCRDEGLAVSRGLTTGMRSGLLAVMTTIRTASTKKKTMQAAHGRSVAVGPRLTEVSPVAYWYKHGHFKNEHEARGAFKLAYQQGLDGMGKSVAAWMGLTSAEYDAWMRSDALPATEKKRRSRRTRAADSRLH